MSLVDWPRAPNRFLQWPGSILTRLASFSDTNLRKINQKRFGTFYNRFPNHAEKFEAIIPAKLRKQKNKKNGEIDCEKENRTDFVENGNR